MSNNVAENAARASATLTQKETDWPVSTMHYIGPALTSAKKKPTLDEIVKRTKEIRDSLNRPPYMPFITDRTSGGMITEEITGNRPELQITLMGEGNAGDVEMAYNEKIV